MLLIKIYSGIVGLLSGLGFGMAIANIFIQEEKFFNIIYAIFFFIIMIINLNLYEVYGGKKNEANKR